MPQPHLCIINFRDHCPMKTDWQNLWYGVALTALLADPNPGASPRPWTVQWGGDQEKHTKKTREDSTKLRTRWMVKDPNVHCRGLQNGSILGKKV